jgi:hypothetical protein
MNLSRLLGAVKEVLKMRTKEPIVDSQYIADHEGLKLKVYKDSRGYSTIGIGHKVVPETPKIMKRLFGEGFDTDSVLGGKRGLSETQAKKLFHYDILKRVPELQQTFPLFHSYPMYLRTAIMDGWFRGDLAGSPRTISFIRDGDFKMASLEYLNHDEYRRSQGTGVASRMEKNAARFYQFSGDKYEQIIQARLKK